MIYLIYLLIIILLFFSIQNILYFIFKVEDSKIVKKVYNATNVSKKKKNYNYIFARYIIIPSYYKKIIDENLKSLNIDMNAEEYYSDGLYKSLPLFMLSIILFVLKLKFIALILLIISSIRLMQNFTRLKRALIYRQILIEEEVPHLIRFFITEVKNNTNIKIIFEKYREIAKNIIPEVDRAILELNLSRDDKDNTIFALQNFADSLNLSIVQDFVTGLIEISKGKNQDNYLALLEREMRSISVKNLERKSYKLEKSVKLSMFMLIGTFIFILVSIIVIYAIYTLNSL